MSPDPISLGGRLPLLDRDALGPEQKTLYDHMIKTWIPMAEAVGFQARTGSGQLIGPFNPTLLNPGIGSRFLELQVAEEKYTSLSQRTRQVIILTVGAVWQAPYELYAHSAVGRRAGLSDHAVRTLAHGGLAADLSAEEATAQSVALALSIEHHLDETLYRDAVRHFGTAGVADIAVLTGIYHTVCAVLNAFAIPAPVNRAEA
jgi:4-carboxymuconolactone decarboxylase